MPVRYVTADDWDAINGADLREALFVDATDTYDATLFERTAEMASKYAQAVAKKAGYSVPADTDGTVVDDYMRLLTLATLTRLGYARRQQEVPEQLLTLYADLVEAARTGDVPDPDLTSNTTSGPGGHRFTSPSTTGTASTTSVFGTLKNVY